MSGPAARGQGERRPVVVLLGDRSAATRAVFHALKGALGVHVSILALLEESPSRAGLARRRAQRLGWWTVTGQVAFVAVVMPALRQLGTRRVKEIAARHRLDFSPIADAVQVGSVNDAGTTETLREADPALVVVHGTRVIAERVLREIHAPVVNLHTGITPRFRGVHGGYWAFFDERPDLAGTTVHLVDTGIDTGGILGQAVFEREARDTVATYPYLQLACGLPVLTDVAAAVLAGRMPAVVTPLPGAESSQLRWHPTAWTYLWARVSRGVC